MLGHLELGDEGNAFLRNIRNRIHINPLDKLEEMSPHVHYSTRLKACIQCTNFDSEGYGKTATCETNVFINYTGC